MNLQRIKTGEGAPLVLPRVAHAHIIKTVRDFQGTACQHQVNFPCCSVQFSTDSLSVFQTTTTDAPESGGDIIASPVLSCSYAQLQYARQLQGSEYERLVILCTSSEQCRLQCASASVARMLMETLFFIAGHVNPNIFPSSESPARSPEKHDASTLLSASPLLRTLYNLTNNDQPPPIFSPDRPQQSVLVQLQQWTAASKPFHLVHESSPPRKVKRFPSLGASSSPLAGSSSPSPARNSGDLMSSTNCQYHWSHQHGFETPVLTTTTAIPVPPLGAIKRQILPFFNVTSSPTSVRQQAVHRNWSRFQLSQDCRRQSQSTTRLTCQ